MRFTKSLSLFLIILLISYISTTAQVSQYIFTGSSGIYIPIIDGTIHGTPNNNNESFEAIPLGFTFNYLGTNYDVISINNNGFIAMGPTVASSVTCLSTGTTNYVISALNMNLGGITGLGQLMSLTEGEAPNRVFTIQWANYQFYGTAGNGDNFNFQIKLFETTNEIEFHYGTFIKNTTNRTAQVGLRGSSSTDVINRSVVAGANFWYNSLEGTSNTASCALTTTTIPETGLIYKWELTDQTFLSSTVVQTAGYVVKGFDNQEVFNIQIVTQGSLNPLAVTNFDLNTLGTAEPEIDLVNAKIFYTGYSTTFSDINQFGETYQNPDGTFSISGSQQLLHGTNNFWLAYSISTDATLFNEVDGECTEITISEIDYVPEVTAPVGSQVIREPFEGSYTIGEDGNFPTLQQAFSDVNALGLTGDVTFEIISDITEAAPAILNQWFEFGDGGYQITIVPTEELRTIQGSFTDALIVLNGADRVTIDGRIDGEGNFLAFQNNSATGPSATIRVASLGEAQGCEDIIIRNCNLTGANMFGNSHKGIYVGGPTFESSSSGFNNDNIQILFNNINRTGIGISIRGAAATGINQDFLIKGNDFGSVDSNYSIGYTGIDFINVNNLTVTENQIHDMYQLAGANLVGIYIGTGTSNILISKNKIYNMNMISGTGGLSRDAGCFAINIMAGSNIEILNNLIYHIRTVNNGTSASAMNPYGIKLSGSVGTKIYYNSIHFYGVPASDGVSGILSACLAVLHSSVADLDVRNNTFVNTFQPIYNTSKSYSVYSSLATNPFATIDYNNYFVGGDWGLLGYFGTIKNSLEEWQIATGQDTHSISLNPLFTDDENLLPQFDSPLILAGLSISEYNDDILGNERGLLPTIGAYEIDASGDMYYFDSKAIQRITSPIIVGGGDQEILMLPVLTRGTEFPVNLNEMTFSTYGSTNPSNDIAEAKLFYTGSSQNFSTENQIGETVLVPSGTFSISGEQELLPGNNFFWLTYAVSNQAVPFNEVDAEFSNIIVSDSNYTPSVISPEGTRIIRAPFSGVYTVGDGGTFPNLYTAFNDIAFLGLEGNTVFEIISDISEPFPAILNQWVEVGEGNYFLTIRPVDGPKTINGSFNNGVIVLNGADRVIIDGSIDGEGNYLTIQNSVTTNVSSAVIRLISLGENLGCEYVTIKNCNLIGISASYTTAFGIFVAGVALTTASTGASHHNLSILNNNIQKVYYGIFVRGVVGNGKNRNMLIKRNNIGSENPDFYIGNKGIDITNSVNALISENKIHDINTNFASNNTGIELGIGTGSAVIENNLIYGITQNSTGVYGTYGINLGGTSDADGIKLVNNVIYDIRTRGNSAISTSGNPFGIRIAGGANHKVWHNSINLFGEQMPGGSQSTLSAAFIVALNTVTGLDVRNNIFANSLTGLAGSSSFSIYSLAPATSFTNIDYNDYYASGSFGVLGFFGTAITTLEAWQTATGQDQNSLAVDPIFISNTDLNLYETSPLSEMGLFLNQAQFDFLGNARTNPTTIGAYETNIGSVLEAPVLITPSNYTFNSQMLVNFVWNEVESAETYRIQIATDITFGNIVFEAADIVETEWINTIALTPSSQYFWRVLAEADGFDAGIWSEVWTLTTLPYLNTPVLVSPINNSIGNSVLPEFIWDIVENADTYVFQLSINSTFDDLLYNEIVTSNNFNLSIQLDYETQYFWKVKALNDIGRVSDWSEVWNFTTEQLAESMEIQLNSGWNMISSYIIPSEPLMPTIFTNILTSVNIVKNGAGQMYDPAFNVNTIGDWNINHGYLVNVDDDNTLTISGEKVIPENHPIELYNGWNLASYLRDNEMQPDLAVASLENSITLMKNNVGGLYMPAYGINTLGNMQPGEGYYFYMNQAAVLTYPANSSRKVIEQNSLTPSAKQLIPIYKNTGNNATLLLNIDDSYNGSEIGIFNSNNELIGSGAIYNGVAAITIWGDDEFTQNIDGAKDNEYLNIKLYNTSDNTSKEISLSQIKEITSNTEQSELYYRTNAIITAKAKTNEEAGFAMSIKNIPNPVENNVVFELSLTDEANAEIQIYTSTGELVTSIVNKVYSAGLHRVNFDASNLANGMYNIVLSSGSKKVSSFMIVGK